MFYKPEMRTVVNVEKPAPVVVDVLMKPVPRYEMQEVETMVTEWEEVEVEEESIEYQWTDKLTTMDTDKVFRHVEITIMRPGDCGSIRTTS